MPTLFQFSGDAYLNEMGITSPDFPNENCPQGNCAELAFNPAPGINDGGEDVSALTDFMTMLAPPRRGPVTPDTTEGEAAFDRIGCNACHVSTLTTGSSPIAALDRKTYQPYSDFLLHDGRARTVDEAILAHDGQGRAARDRCAALAADVKAKVLTFLQSL